MLMNNIDCCMKHSSNSKYIKTSWLIVSMRYWCRLFVFIL